MAQSFRITSIGAKAQRVLLAGGPVEVLAVFERSLHLRCPSGYVCVVGEPMGRGPLNAVVGVTFPDGWQPPGLGPRTRGEVRDGRLVLGAMTLDFVGAALWTPPPWSPRPPAPALRDALARFGDVVAASDRLPLDGCARVAFGTPVTAALAGAVMRKALLATATLGDWLADVLADADAADATLAEAARESVTALLGLGPGLTPAGDDVLAGLLIGLHAASEVDAANALAAMIRATSPGATSEISHAFLEAAMDGLPSEPLADAIAAVMTGDEARFPAIIERIDGVGHTSGWDMLAGAVLALAAVAAT